MVQRQARYVYPVLALSSLLAVLLLELGGVFDTALSLE